MCYGYNNTYYSFKKTSAVGGVSLRDEIRLKNIKKKINK